MARMCKNLLQRILTILKSGFVASFPNVIDPNIVKQIRKARRDVRQTKEIAMGHETME